MSFIRPLEKEINCKIVYYGAGLAGKSSNLQAIFKKTGSEKNGKLVSLTDTQDRTLFFDFLPLTIQKVKGFTVRFHIYTVPGQVLYENSRKIILKGVDGVVFVVDSQVQRIEDSLKSWQGLKSNLKELGGELEKIPLVIQYNKRDIPSVAPVLELQKIFNQKDRPSFEAIATKGVGVMESLQSISKQVLQNLKKS